MVLAAGTAESPEAAAALSRLPSLLVSSLCLRAAPGFRRTRGERFDAGFFEQFLARNDLAKADPERGRFRSFLLKCLQHYLANEQRHARRLKRGGGQPAVSLDDTAETLPRRAAP